jgi:hypothetical protein
MSDLSPLLEVERKLDFGAIMSAFEKQTGAPLQCSGRAQRAVSELATDIGKSVVASGR